MSGDLDVLSAALPDYEVGEELGHGGFGVVHSGRHRQMAREVAIKELPPFLAIDPKVRARFVAEARVLAALTHPHIVTVFDYVEREGLCLLVMEKLTGGTVWDHFTSEGFTPETATAVGMAVCAGLHYAHERGVLHRDMKPENLIFSAEGVLKVTDFGIARVIGGGEMLATQAGEILGTPAYMAPEQAEGLDLGPPADVYATAVMLYELLSGKLPYSEDGGALAIVYRHIYEDPTPIKDVAPGLPQPLADVTMKALAREPADRFPTSEAFGVALGEAATSLWGPGWLAQARVALMAPGPILTSAERPSRNIAPTATPRPPTQTRVRAKKEAHGGGGAVADMAAGELVPVRDVIAQPPSPLLPGVIAFALLVVTAALAFAGLGEPARAASLPPGTALVGGVDPAGPDPIPLDLAEPVEVRLVELPAAAAGATELSLALSVTGVPMFESGAEPLTPLPEGGIGASLDAAANRYVAAGEATGILRFRTGDTEVLTHEFPVDPAQSPFLTVPGVLGVVLMLFVLSYAESLLRPLRKGRRLARGLIGLVLVGAVAGLAAVIFAWLLGAPEPGPAAAAVCGAGAAAGAAGAVAAARIGKRRRMRRAKSRSRAVPAAA